MRVAIETTAVNWICWILFLNSCHGSNRNHWMLFCFALLPFFQKRNFPLRKFSILVHSLKSESIDCNWAETDDCNERIFIVVRLRDWWLIRCLNQYIGLIPSLFYVLLWVTTQHFMRPLTWKIYENSSKILHAQILLELDWKLFWLKRSKLMRSKGYWV